MSEQREHIGCVEDADSTFCDSSDCWCAAFPAVPVAPTLTEIATKMCNIAGILRESVATLTPAPVATAETAQASRFIADETLKRIAERYRNCSVNIYPDFPEVTPVEAVLRCALEEGFVLRLAATPPPQPAGTPPRWGAEIAARAEFGELEDYPPPTGTPEPLRELVNWLRNYAEERVKEAMARESMSGSARHATPKELRAAKILAEQMAGRKLPLVTTDIESANREADIQDRIAVKLIAEAKQVSVWADMLAAVPQASPPNMAHCSNPKCDYAFPLPGTTPGVAWKCPQCYGDSWYVEFSSIAGGVAAGNPVRPLSDNSGQSPDPYAAFVALAEGMKTGRSCTKTSGHAPGEVCEFAPASPQWAAELEALIAQQRKGQP